jgi:hypothetical protein
LNFKTSTLKVIECGAGILPLTVSEGCMMIDSNLHYNRVSEGCTVATQKKGLPLEASGTNYICGESKSRYI